MGAYHHHLWNKTIPFFILLPDEHRPKALSYHHEAMCLTRQKCIAARHIVNTASKVLNKSTLPLSSEDMYGFGLQLLRMQVSELKISPLMGWVCLTVKLMRSWTAYRRCAGLHAHTITKDTTLQDLPGTALTNKLHTSSNQSANIIFPKPLKLLTVRKALTSGITHHTVLLIRMENRVLSYKEDLIRNLTSRYSETLSHLNRLGRPHIFHNGVK